MSLNIGLVSSGWKTSGFNVHRDRVAEGSRHVALAPRRVENELDDKGVPILPIQCREPDMHRESSDNFMH